MVKRKSFIDKALSSQQRKACVPAATLLLPRLDSSQTHVSLLVSVADTAYWEFC